MRILGRFHNWATGLKAPATEKITETSGPTLECMCQAQGSIAEVHAADGMPKYIRGTRQQAHLAQQRMSSTKSGHGEWRTEWVGQLFCVSFGSNSLGE